MRRNAALLIKASGQKIKAAEAAFLSLKESYRLFKGRRSKRSGMNKAIYKAIEYRCNKSLFSFGKNNPITIKLGPFL
jgi:hypothetical protein